MTQLIFNNFSGTKDFRFLIFGFIFAAAFSLNVSAATLTVSTLADNESNGCLIGQCTLREAIETANASPGADTIIFGAGASSGTIKLTGGQLVITSNLTISGSGARNLTISGDNQSRVILIATPLFGGDFTVNISGLTITGGNATPVLIGTTLIGDGGGILNGALLDVASGISTLNLSDAVVTGNSTTTLGGGIATRLGAVTNITRSLVSGNFANPVIALDDGSVGGGGISNAAFSTTTLSDSTVTNNESLAAGGGILNVAGTVNLTNDTISHNRSVLAGGGVVSLIGAVPAVLGVTNVRNTIIAKNNDLLATNIIGRDVVGILGSFNSLGNNLIGSNFGAEADFAASVFVGISAQPNVKADLVGGISVGNQIIDPLLGNLMNNGGLTDTRAIMLSSPALNKANSCVANGSCTPFLMTDQRGAGFNRLSGTAVDIGAFELQLSPTAAGVSLSGTVTRGGSAMFGATVLLIANDGQVRSTETNEEGYYQFDEVVSGETYLIRLGDDSYQAAPQLVFVTEEMNHLDFADTGAIGKSRKRVQFK